MDRQTFRRIVLRNAFQKRKMYESLLESVPLLSALNVSFVHILIDMFNVDSTLFKPFDGLHFPTLYLTFIVPSSDKTKHDSNLDHPNYKLLHVFM